MRAFSALLERLYYTYGNNAKARILGDYLRSTPDPDRGYALAAIAGTLEAPEFKRSMVRELVMARIDPVLFELSYDYIGEMSETVAHLWPGKTRAETLPSLGEVVTALRSLDKGQIRDWVARMLDVMDSSERWAFLKLGSRGGLRVGISARFLKQVLAQIGGQELQAVEAAWHAVDPPYIELFAWLEGKRETPFTRLRPTFHPVMLAQALEEKDHPAITPEAFAAEWKYDGIRVQIVASPVGKALYSRSGDDIGTAFPEVLARADFDAVLDGELLVQAGDGVGSFNDLQQRLNRKAPTKKMLQDSPAIVLLYDLLFADGEDCRPLPFIERRQRLEAWHARTRPAGFSLAPQLAFESFDKLAEIRLASEGQSGPIEGVMLKRKDSAYVAGRPAGQWYKWKREPMLVDAVMMYAQRGHGKRSSLYSDYTFGLWRGNELLPIGKAYFGFTDEELKQLDRWVRHHTLQSFGPVREVSKELVLEIAFDAVNRSTRHKSGYALRFPRIHRIRWDKPAPEADRLEALEALV
jgi:DNA ligase-1